MANNDSEDVMASTMTSDGGVTLALMAAVLSVVAIFSNGLLIYVVVCTDALRTSTNLFIASLAGGELVTGLFVIPFAGKSALSGVWAFSSETCSFVGVMGVLGPCVSTLSLLAVSADRCVAVGRPFRYASLVTTSFASVVIVGVWLWSMLMSLLPLADWGRFSYSGNFMVCLMRSSSETGTGDVPEVVVKETLCIFLPVVFIIAAVLKTVHHIRGHRRVFVLMPAIVAATSVSALSSNVSSRNSNLKASRTLLLVLAVFLTLCVPYGVASILCHRPSSCYVRARLLRALLWLSFLSCVINPLIIMTLNRKFRARLKALFYARSRCWSRLVGHGEKEPFTISSGLQTILDTSLLVKVIKAPAPNNHPHHQQQQQQQQQTADGVQRQVWLAMQVSADQPSCYVTNVRQTT